jgi:hypothetical protein
MNSLYPFGKILKSDKYTTPTEEIKQILNQ